jgi:hypothetical protein
MRCRVIQYPTGGGVIVCGPKAGSHIVDGKCSYCESTAEATCDFPVGRAVCAVPVCADHLRTRSGADYCPAHAKPLAL